MKDLKITIRTADQTRRADVELNDQSQGTDLIQRAVDNWALPADTDYSLVNVTSGQVLNPRQPIGEQVKEGDTLEVQPVLVAG